MPSLIPHFEYDIFISYRHNDNKSGWVTDFVNALQEELAATIKEPLSIYFDKNPHDGLLETHNVDKSLEGKLKCLIFIPIISQTYCDTKSFAWQHEFVAFNKLTKEDEFKRDIKLSNGNVASRILPIKIHDLDAEDKATIENEIGGALRAIEFIFKSLGVNRPLRVTEEHPHDNLNKTFYRDQINKVANAIKEIVTALKNPAACQQQTAISYPSIDLQQRRNFAVGALILVSLIILSYLFYPKFTTDNREVVVDNSIAVLAFEDLSPQHDQEWFSDGLSEEILNSLTRFKKLKVMARTSSFYFKRKPVTIAEIGEKLGVAHVVEGSVKRLGNQLRITAQLIRVKDGFHIWSQEYDRPADDLFAVQINIAENIAKSLIKELSPEDVTILEVDKPTNSKAYEFFIRGLYFHDRFRNSFDDIDFRNAEIQLRQAILIDSDYGAAMGELANLYDSKGTSNQTFVKKRDSLAGIAYRLSPRSANVLSVMAYSYMNRNLPNLDSAFYFIQVALRIHPHDPWVNRTSGIFYQRTGLPDLATAYFEKASKLDPYSPTHLRLLGQTQFFLGQLSLAKTTMNKLLTLDSSNLEALLILSFISVCEKDIITLDSLRMKIEGNIKLARWASSYIGLISSLLQGKTGVKEALATCRNAYDKFLVFYAAQDVKNMIRELQATVQTDETLSFIELRDHELYRDLQREPEFLRILNSLEQRDKLMREKFGVIKTE
jgi:TolB-like protein